MATARPRRTSSVRHTRAIQRDRSKRPTVSPPAPAIQDHLTALIHPATFAQLDHFRALGLRDRILTLPVMVAFVLSLLWRRLGSVSEAVRVLTAEGMLWTSPVQVSQQAMSRRLRTFPAVLFERILLDVLPAMQARWQTRRRPLPPVIQRARPHFPTIVALDGSTLDGLLRQVGLLRAGEGPVLAGRMAGLIDLASRLPHQLWYEPDSQARDRCSWARALAGLAAGVLVVFDLGFTNYALFDQLTDQLVSFITRAKQNRAYRVERVLTSTEQVRDQLVGVGTGAGRCTRRLRLVEGAHQGRWFRYLTNVLDPAVLAARAVAALYWQRWRIEAAFAVVKRLLGLASFSVGSVNGATLQVWAIRLLYAAAVGLTDAVAERLAPAARAASIAVVFRGLYHFTAAYHRGAATDPVAYLALNAARLGIRKRERRSSGEQMPLTCRDGP